MARISKAVFRGPRLSAADFGNLWHLGKGEGFTTFEAALPKEESSEFWK